MLQLHAAAVAAPSRAALPLRAARAALPAPSALRPRAAPRRRASLAAGAKKSGGEAAPESAPLSGPAAAVVYAGAVSLPVTFWSEYTLFTTGAGLQGDVLGGVEGVSYLVLLAVLGVSLQKKLSTGVGLEGILPGERRDAIAGCAVSVRACFFPLAHARCRAAAPPPPGAQAAWRASPSWRRWAASRRRV
jgi:hypothetical protein